MTRLKLSSNGTVQRTAPDFAPQFSENRVFFGESALCSTPVELAVVTVEIGKLEPQTQNASWLED
jgi:hypothetical protein